MWLETACLSRSLTLIYPSPQCCSMLPLPERELSSAPIPHETATSLDPTTRRTLRILLTRVRDWGPEVLSLQHALSVLHEGVLGYRVLPWHGLTSTRSTYSLSTFIPCLSVINRELLCICTGSVYHYVINKYSSTAVE